MFKEYLEGRIKVVCGDCNKLIAEMPDSCAHVACFDPPYKMEIHGRGFAAKRDYYSALDYGTDLDFKLSDEFMANLERVCNRKSFFIFANKYLKLDVENWAVSKNWSFDEIKLLKDAPAPLTNNQWLPDSEYGVHIYNRIPVFGSYRTKKTFFIDSNFKDVGVNHPSPKPVYMLAKIIQNITQEDETVFDPYMGSGSCAIACLETNRRFIGFEINEAFFKDTCERIEMWIAESKSRLF